MNTYKCGKCNHEITKEMYDCLEKINSLQCLECGESNYIIVNEKKHFKLDNNCAFPILFIRDENLNKEESDFLVIEDCKFFLELIEVLLKKIETPTFCYSQYIPWKSEQNHEDFDLNYDNFKEEHDNDEIGELLEQELEPDEEERIEEIVEDNFDSVAKILADRQQQEEIGEIQIESDSKKVWSIPRGRKQQAEEIADEKSYLEEISF